MNSSLLSAQFDEYLQEIESQFVFIPEGVRVEVGSLFNTVLLVMSGMIHPIGYIFAGVYFIIATSYIYTLIISFITGLEWNTTLGRGSSMSPSIPQGANCMISKPVNGFEKNDIVSYVVPNGDFDPSTPFYNQVDNVESIRTHRVLKVGDDAVFLHGDNNILPDGWVPKELIIKNHPQVGLQPIYVPISIRSVLETSVKFWWVLSRKNQDKISEEIKKNEEACTIIPEEEGDAFFEYMKS